MASKTEDPETTKAVATTPETGGFLSLANPDLQLAMSENLGPAGSTTLLDLPRLKVPAGGGLAWTIHTLEGPKPEAEIEGVIVHWTQVRAYWQSELGAGGGSAPPDCTSRDGEYGIGEPGGVCAECPMNQFNTAPGNRPGKACREARGMLVAIEGQAMPMYLPAPVMSIKPLREYFMRLASAAKPYYGIVSSFKLEQAQNNGGVVYSRIVPGYVRDLSPEERKAIDAYRAAILPAFAANAVLRKSDLVD
jgi:hypothetical protein